VVTIDEELEAARQAKTAIETLWIRAPSEAAIRFLRKGYRMATNQIKNLPSEKPLNDARQTVGIAVPVLINAFEEGQQSQEEIDKAKSAIEAWIKLLQR
jgi:hypothetical protein